MMHGNNNNHNRNRNNNNNNRRFSKNNNFKKRPFGMGGGSGSSRHMEDEQISPQQRRNFENKRDQHLMKAKEYLAAGERVEAENHFQHADHYFRMANIGLDKLQQQQAQQAQQQAQNNYNSQQENQSDNNYGDAPVIDDAPYADVPEIPVDMMGRFPSEENAEPRNNNVPRGRNPRYNREGHGNRDNRNEPPREAREPREPQANRPEAREPREPREPRAPRAPRSQPSVDNANQGAPADNNLAALPFMQVPIKES